MLVAGFARPDDKIVTERIKVREMKPTVLLMFLYAPQATIPATFSETPHRVGDNANHVNSFVPAGITDLTPRDNEDVLVARGPAAAIAELKEVIKMLDVKLQSLRLMLQVVRFTMTESGKSKTQVLNEASVGGVNNSTTFFTMRGGDADIAIEARPRIIDGDRIFLRLGFHLFKDPGGSTFSHMDSRRFPLGKKTLITRYTNSTSPRVIEQVAQGETPTMPGNYSIYFVYVTATRER